MNGKPGDHPITDITLHGLEVYGPEADDLIRKIRDIEGRVQLYEWWNAEIGWKGSPECALNKARTHYREIAKPDD